MPEEYQVYFYDLASSRQRGWYVGITEYMYSLVISDDYVLRVFLRYIPATIVIGE